MKRLFPLLLCSLLLLALAACNKSTGTAESTAKPVATNPSPTAAAPAAAAPAAQPAAAPVVNADGSSADTTAKLAATDWALKQDEIKHDPKGQWAISATASSAYRDAKGPQDWSAEQAAGEPNAEKYQDDSHAWAPRDQDSGIEWLDLKYAKPVYATEVRVRESLGSGAVIKVELYDEQGNIHKVWQGVDPTTELNYLLVKFPKTAYKTDRVKVTLATNVIPGWNEIDAVQLVGSDKP